MTNDAPPHNTAEIRQWLTAAFDDAALDAFCLDYFPRVYDRFGRGLRMDEKITILLDYCRHQPGGLELLTRLLADLAPFFEPSQRVSPRERADDIFGKAIHRDIMGDLGYALQLYRQVQQLDPTYPRIGAIVYALEQEMQEPYVDRNGYVRDEYFRSRRHVVRSGYPAAKPKSRAFGCAVASSTTMIGVVILVVASVLLWWQVTSSPTATSTPTLTPTATSTPTPTPTYTPTPTPTYTPTPTPTPPCGGGRIAFYSYRDGDAQIYVMNADGSGPTKLTNNPGGGNYVPAWSPDGQQIAFDSTRDGGKQEIYVMNANGSGQRNLTNNPAGDYTPAWSPDGQHIAFASDRDGNAEIYVMAVPDGTDVDGSEPKNLTNNPAGDATPAWSPDGRIVFASDRDGNREIYVMNADGSEQTRLTNDAADDFSPAWSPDGTRIAFVSQRDGNEEIYVMNIDGTGQMNLTKDPAADWAPSWSPDGRCIVFESWRDGNKEIYVMNADGSGPRNLTNDPADDLDPAWSPPTPTNTPTPTPCIYYYDTDNGSGGVETITLTPCLAAEIRIDLYKRALTIYGFALFEVEAYGPDDPGKTRNLLKGGKACASSCESPQKDACKAIDDLKGSWWSSDRDEPEWLAIILPQPEMVKYIVLRWETAYAQEYLVTVMSTIDADGAQCPACPPPQ